MDEYLAGLTTEAINSETAAIDECTTEQMLRLMNEQDAKVPQAVAAEIPQIVKAVNSLHQVLKHGGRMFYVGAGSSGRMGVLDASECPPTFEQTLSWCKDISPGRHCAEMGRRRL